MFCFRHVSLHVYIVDHTPYCILVMTRHTHPHKHPHRETQRRTWIGHQVVTGTWPCADPRGRWAQSGGRRLIRKEVRPGGAGKG